jgi:uncharacterized phiE125 gp8 family phage protein
MSNWDEGIHARLSLVTAAEEEPVTLDEAKLQTRREHVTHDDTYLETICIPAARDRGEQATGRQFITATWQMTLDRFPCSRYIELPKPPLQSVTSVTYVDENGATQTLATTVYSVDAPEGPTCARGRIALKYDQVWPSTRYQPNCVTITFVAGYGDDGESVPARLKMGMLLDIGTLYEIREDYIVGQGYTVSPVPIGSERIYQTFKSWPRG